jgi:hypothetical protein
LRSTVAQLSYNSITPTPKSRCNGHVCPFTKEHWRWGTRQGFALERLLEPQSQMNLNLTQ